MNDNKILQADIPPAQINGIIEPTDLKNVQNFFDVVDTVPTHVPKSFWDSRKIYVNGATKREYVYDFKNRAWYYSALT